MLFPPEIYTEDKLHALKHTDIHFCFIVIEIDIAEFPINWFRGIVDRGTYCREWAGEQ